MSGGRHEGDQLGVGDRGAPGSVLHAALRRELTRPGTVTPPAVPVFRGGTGPQPGIDLTSNRSLHEALDEGIALDRRR